MGIRLSPPTFPGAGPGQASAGCFLFVPTCEQTVTAVCNCSGLFLCVLRRRQHLIEPELSVSVCTAGTMFHVKRGTVRQWRPRSLYQLRSYPGSPAFTSLEFLRRTMGRPLPPTEACSGQVKALACCRVCSERMSGPPSQVLDAAL
jgi:hypothetical protein